MKKPVEIAEQVSLNMAGTVQDGQMASANMNDLMDIDWLPYSSELYMFI